ncbi:lysosomal-trafficking regulator isoform x1 [Limosa lapponica baueri]|uniref:Guanine nucleotide-binding protein subunit gamma n=74 Tax=Neoaves TaxID=3078114 RepID=A0A2I0URA3_LIMLA|nr:lysosomal-trafficking regulator isoform x1 [Limosa lapponica baueri]
MEFYYNLLGYSTQSPSASISLKSFPQKTDEGDLLRALLQHLEVKANGTAALLENAGACPPPPLCWYSAHDYAIKQNKEILALLSLQMEIQKEASKIAGSESSDMSSASNSLAREFLTDVNRLCNAVVQRAEAKEDEEEETHMAALGQYLVQGRGFVLLTTLNSTIDQELTCREELLTLLLSLLPLVWKIPVQEEKAIDFNIPFTVDLCLTKENNSSSVKSTQEKVGLDGSTRSSLQTFVKLNPRSRKSGRLRKTTHRYSVRDARRSQLSTSDSEGNSDEKTTVITKHRRAQLLQPFLTYPVRDSSFVGRSDCLPAEVVPDSNPNAHNLENSSQMSPTHDLNPETLNEPAAGIAESNTDNSPFDLCHVLLSLLEKVCKFDITLNHSSALSASVVPTLTEFLSGFGDCYNVSGNTENEVSAGWTEEPVALIQRMLFRSVLHLMSLDISSTETMPDNLRRNLIDLLKAALKIRICLEKQPDPFAPGCKKTLQQPVQEDFVFSRYHHRALLLPEVIEGVLRILICCLQSAASNPLYFSQAIDLVHEFIQHQGFKLFEVTVLQMEWLCMKNEGVTGEASEHLKALINSIMKIISTVKKVKSEQLHQLMCTRKRHRRCEYSHFMHHHRDLSGLSVSAFKSQASKNPFETADGEVHYPDRCCCIAVCAHQCLHLLQRVSLSSTCVQILSGVHNVGICCCMDPKSVIVPLLHASKLPILKNFQQHILNILNKFILDQLGGAEVSPKIMQASCNICTVDCDQLAQLEDALQGNSSDAGLASSSSCRVQGILPSSGSEDMLLRWDALEAYQDVVFEEDKLCGMQIASHICHLIQKGNAVVQWKLYNCIYNPVLQRGVELACHAQQLGLTTADKHTCSYHNQCLPSEVLQIYLQTLPVLLKSRIIRDLFLSGNGVNQMTELNYLDTLRSHSLKVLETLILCLGDQQKDQAMPELEGLNSEQKESTSDLPASLCSQHPVSEVPQSLSKFYAGLKEAYPKKKKFMSQDIHVNTINLFLCVAFLCVSKEADGDLDSANDSEDTSGYDSTASEPLGHKLPYLSLESLTLPSLEHIHRAADIWSMCRCIYLCSSVFQRQFHRLGGFEACHRLLILIIQKLAKNKEKEQEKERVLSESSRSPHESPHGELLNKDDSVQLDKSREVTQLELDSSNSLAGAEQLVPELASCDSSLSREHTSVTSTASLEGIKTSAREETEWALQGIRLLESLLTICLHSTSTVQQKMEVEMSHQSTCVDDILLQIREQLAQSKVIETDLAKPLFDSLLRVALGTFSADLDHSEEKIEKMHYTEKEPVSQPEDISEETEESQCCSLKLFAEEEGYEADSESNPDDSETKNEGADTKAEPGFTGPSGYFNVRAESINQGELIMSDGTGRPVSFLDEFTDMFRRANSSSEDIFGEDTLYEETKSIGMEYPSLGDKLVEDGCIHIISLGSKALMIQVWADLNTGAFIFRMCMDPNDEMKAGLLAQAESPENVFLMGRWQHLAITYLQQPEGKKNIRGKLSLWVSGQRKCEINLDYALPRKSSLSSDSNKTFCMIGHCTSSQEELLRLSGAKIGPEEAFYLYTCGPDFTSVMPCKYGKTLTDCSKYISKEILQCEQIKELFMAKKEVDVGPLIESLAVVYTTCCPGQYTIYEPVIRLKGQVKTVPSQRPFSLKEVQSNALDSHHLKTLQPVEYKTLQGILHEIGGTGAFVFLFARVVEISSCEDTQALALQLILSLTKYNQQRIQEMDNCNGYSMIHRVLIKPKCIVGFCMLKTLLEGCCSDEILYMNENGQFKLDTDSTAVIQDVQLLEKLLLDWKIWSKAKEHKEGHLASLPREVCRSFVKIIEEVLGSPPDLELLTLVFNFLLAVHPPTNTYVCHNPTNFYFSLHIDGKIFQEKVESLMYLRNSSSGGKSIDSTAFVITTPTGFTALPLEENASKASVLQKISSQAPKRLCKSLPASLNSSPQIHRKRLTERGGRSVDDLQVVGKHDYIDLQGKTGFVGSSETIKRVQEELFLSSCESAKTVCDSELTSVETFEDIAKEELPENTFENKEADTDLKCNEGGGAAAEPLLRRPDNLKGLPSFQRSQSNFAGLGLAFSVHGGSSAIARWPSFADKSILPEDWESLAFSSANENTQKPSESPDDRCTEDCLVLICCGLYDLLRGVLLILPDIMLEDVMDKLIQPDYLIVLVNHPSPLIQQGVIKLLDAYFNRARREQKEKFLKNRGFSLLANQLYLHQGTQEVVECFLEMLFGRSVGLDEEFDLEDVKNVGLFQKWCVIPVLGLIENSLYDNVLLHNCFCLLLQIINSCSKVADLLLDNGLLYVLCNTLAALNGLETNIPLNDYKLLACDIQQLLVAVAIHACSSSGSQYFRVIEDLIVLLGHLQNSKNARMQNMAVVLQLRVLQAAIELIKTTANQDAQEQTGSVPSPSAPHRAMFQKRKGIAGSRKFSLAQSDALLMKMRSLASEEFNMMMQRRMSQENPIQATETEFVQRLQRLTVLAVNRLIYLASTEECLDVLGITETTSQSRLSAAQLEAPEEESQQELPSRTNPFLKEMFKMLVEGVKVSLGSSRMNTPKQQWKRILLSCKDTFRTQLGRLLVHNFSPTRPLQERKQALEMVHEVNHQEIMRDCLSPTLQHGPKLVLYLYELMHNHSDEMTKEQQRTAGDFVNTLKCCGYKCIPLSPRPKPDLIKALKEDQKKYEMEEGVNKAAWEKTMANNRQNLFQRLDTKSKDISKIAGDITQAVSLSQGMERKKVIQHIRGMYKAELSASRHWQELVQQLTHDRALWYDPVYYPTSWQLDPTEGPNRERRRLQRCYLTIPNKYLLPDRQKQEGKCGMYFVEDNASDTIENSSFHGETEPASFSWTYEEIKEVHKRWWQLRDNAVEIFLTNGRTLLLAFDNTKVRDDVYHNILTNNLPNLLEYGNITALTHLWCTGQITNFEYLTHLNKHAGRSFNDLMQYPVFPFILSDYTNETLDLNDPSVYRNLVKPIAVQSKEKEDRYVDTYKYLEEEYRKGAREDDPMPPVQPYHYGSHYSNSGTVLHFLVRLPPFTKMFLAYQDQSFDIPDRTFHSTNTTWRLSSYESMTDVKELIPEFFYLPDFLVNREGFDFGVRQNGDRVNHVNLPPWARNDPRLFILIHRQALESDHVSQTICHWIDLVFGYKQKGKASVQAINVFHPATYFGMDVSAVEDPVQRRALETMIKTYGQTPRQLFHAAHVSRPGSRLIMEGELPAAMGLLVQFAFRETREHTKEIIYPSPLPWIKGLKWGEYVGSPSAPDPVVCFSQPHGERFGSLQALPTKAICGLSRKFCLLMIYSKEQGVRSMHSTDIQWSAILSWGYADNILRLKSKQSEPPVNFIQSSQFHQVTSCAWVPDSCQLFTGSKSGVITAYMNRFTSNTPSEIEMESQVHLYGHTAEITSLFVCKPYSIMISVSKDGTCIIWDLNRLCYVQSLAGHKSPVTAVSASETTGDIATVCDSVGGGSDLRLWTVNGDLVGHVHCRESICSVAFSNQPEGVSVNVIAGGLENGVVRLWSTWDLKPVREITFSKSAKPIVRDLAYLTPDQFLLVLMPHISKIMKWGSFLYRLHHVAAKLNGGKNKMKELVSNSTTNISQARKAVEQLKMEAYMDRMKVSKAAADLLAYCDAHIGEDPLIIPVPASENPFREKKLFCTIL